MSPRGPIALLGSGEFEPWTSDVDRLLLERATAGTGTVAIVPTASALEGRRFDDWARDGLEHYAGLGVPARLIDLRGRDDADRADLIEQLEDTSLIFFSGGNPAFLARTLAGTPFWDAVVDRVADGAAFAGCSAGACIAGAFAPESMTDDVWEESWMPGLDLVPDVWVLPHFAALDRYRPDLRSYFVSRVPDDGWALGIDERTAVVGLGDAWTVHGEGGAFLSRGRLARRFSPGETFRLGDLDLEAADRDLVLAVEPVPAGSAPIALLSSEQFSPGSLEVDRVLLEAAGPRVGVLPAGDPSGRATIEAQAVPYYRSIGAEPRILAPGDGLGDVDALVLPGGDPTLLVSALRHAPSWTEACETWRAGSLALAGSSAGAMALWERCLLPVPGADVPTIWGEGLGPLRGAGLAVHAASRPPTWLEDVTSRAPVDVLAMDDGAALVLRPGRAPVRLGEGAITRFPATAIDVAGVAG